MLDVLMVCVYNVMHSKCFSTSHNTVVCSPPCQNGGTCTEHGCDCPTGYTGRACSGNSSRKTLTLLVHRVITILCSAASCFPHCINGQCTIPRVGQRGVCVCDPGWTGEDCNESKTWIWLSINITVCSYFPCNVLYISIID